MSNSTSPVVSTVACDNEYITVVNKRIRAYKKKIDRILALRGKENLEKDQIELCARFDVFNSILTELYLVKSNMLEIAPAESVAMPRGSTESVKQGETIESLDGAQGRREEQPEELSEKSLEEREVSSEPVESVESAEPVEPETSEEPVESEEPEEPEQVNVGEVADAAEEAAATTVEAPSKTGEEMGAQGEAEGVSVPEKSGEPRKRDARNHFDAKERRRNQYPPRRERRGDRPYGSYKDWKGNGRRNKTEDKDGWVTMKKGYK